MLSKADHENAQKHAPIAGGLPAYVLPKRPYQLEQDDGLLVANKIDRWVEEPARWDRHCSKNYGKRVDC